MAEGEGRIEGAGHSEWCVALTVAALTDRGGIGPRVAEAASEMESAATTAPATDAEADADAASVACSCQRCGRRTRRASAAVS
jgi:hypothetical protein